LKPENLLMVSNDDDADVKIVDFGFAAITHGDTLTNQCGTPGYIAPEILQGKLHGAHSCFLDAFTCSWTVLVYHVPFLYCFSQAHRWTCGRSA
jgi:serine/threonine protein kinase